MINLIRLLVIFAVLSPLTAAAANYTLEIIQPQAGLTTANRFYKAYPGIEYNVRLGVIGGVYPYVYSLTTAPSGMIIDSKTGEISWPNPTTSGSPHSVTARVVDTESVVDTVSWTITVTTSGFIFIDPVDGNHSTTAICTGTDGANSIPAGTTGTGTGTLANPFKSLADIYQGACYNAKHNTAFSTDFVYFRGGTYYLDTYIDHVGDGENQQTAFTYDEKPLVWLAYPGETPVIDFEGAYTHLFFEENSGNTIYIDGLSVTNGTGKTFTVPSTTNPVFRRITGTNHGAITSEHYNQSYILLSRSGQGDNAVIQDCNLSDLDHGAAIKVYDANKVLIENNVIHDITDTMPKDGSPSIEGIALKVDVTNATVRGNKIYNVPQYPIGGDMTGEDVACGDFEISHNYVQNPSAETIYVNRDPYNTSGPVQDIYMHHNTFVGRVQLNRSNTDTGPYWIYNNVLVQSEGEYVQQIDLIDASTTHASDNLTSTATTGMIDADGILDVLQSAYIGLRGWQLPDGSTPLVGGGYDPPDPGCDIDHPSLCTTEGECEAVTGLYWCDGACQAGECSPPPSGGKQYYKIGSGIVVPVDSP